MIRKGYYSFTHCGHDVVLEAFTDENYYLKGYATSWWISVDGEATELEPRLLRRDAKAAAINYINHIHTQVGYHLGCGCQPII